MNYEHLTLHKERDQEEAEDEIAAHRRLITELATIVARFYLEDASTSNERR